MLAALVKGGTILIPLRSMFEQMGATVSYDAGSKTATVTKPGAEVKVTVGKPEVIINGESRPLDVPPDDLSGRRARSGSRHFGRHGRLRAVGSGQASGRRAVHSRDAAAEPGSAAAAPPPPPPPPTADARAAAPVRRSSPATTSSRRRCTTSSAPAIPGNSSFAIRGAGEFTSRQHPVHARRRYERWQYPHNCTASAGARGGSSTSECYVTTIGGDGSSPVLTTTQLYDQDVDARLAVRVLNPRVYIGVGYMWVSGNYGYPNMNGVGIRRRETARPQPAALVLRQRLVLPERQRNVHATWPSAPINPQPTTRYNILKYQVGVTTTASATARSSSKSAGWATTGRTSRTPRSTDLQRAVRRPGIPLPIPVVQLVILSAAPGGRGVEGRGYLPGARQPPGPLPLLTPFGPVG